MTTLLRATRLALIPVTVLALLGAAEGACVKTPEGGSVETDAKGASACLQSVVAPQIIAGKIVAQGRATCYKAVVRHEMTVTLQKQTPTGWQNSDQQVSRKAPALNVLKTLDASIPCAAGAYRTHYAAFVEAVSEPDHEGDSGTWESPVRVVTKEECR